MAFLRPAYYADSEMDFRAFAASLLWGFGWVFSDFKAGLLCGNTAVAAITIGGWAKVIIPGGIRGGLLQKWNLDRWYAGRNEHTMGIEGSEMAFLRPPYYRDSDQNCRVFEASLVRGITEDRTAGKQSERDRVLPEFPKTRRARAAFW